jgi:hypothetical protein
MVELIDFANKIGTSKSLRFQIESEAFGLKKLNPAILEH